MSARPISEILAPIIERCASMDLLHKLLRSMPASADRKALLMSFREIGTITHEEAALLLEAYQLETA